MPLSEGCTACKSYSERNFENQTSQPADVQFRAAPGSCGVPSTPGPEGKRYQSERRADSQVVKVGHGKRERGGTWFGRKAQEGPVCCVSRAEDCGGVRGFQPDLDGVRMTAGSRKKAATEASSQKWARAADNQMKAEGARRAPARR